MNTLIHPSLPATPMAKAITTVLGYRDAVGNDDWNAALDCLEANQGSPLLCVPFDVQNFLDTMHRLLAEARGALPQVGDTTWFMDCIGEDLDNLKEIHIGAPKRAEDAEQERHDDVMENGTYAERRFEVLGDEL